MTETRGRHWETTSHLKATGQGAGSRPTAKASELCCLRKGSHTVSSTLVGVKLWEAGTIGEISAHRTRGDGPLLFKGDRAKEGDRREREALTQLPPNGRLAVLSHKHTGSPTSCPGWPGSGGPCPPPPNIKCLEWNNSCLTLLGHPPGCSTPVGKSETHVGRE